MSLLGDPAPDALGIDSTLTSVAEETIQKLLDANEQLKLELLGLLVSDRRESVDEVRQFLLDAGVHQVNLASEAPKISKFLSETYERVLKLEMLLEGKTVSIAGYQGTLDRLQLEVNEIESCHNPDFPTTLRLVVHYQGENEPRRFGFLAAEKFMSVYSN